MVQLENIPLHFTIEGWFHYLIISKQLSLEELKTFLFFPIGSSFRNVNSEIFRLEAIDSSDFALHSDSEELNSENIIWLVRDGFYHKLPHFLFHSFNYVDERLEPIKKIEKERNETVISMKSLLPIDNEFLYQKISLFDELKKYSSQSFYTHFKKIFEWKFNKMEKENIHSNGIIPKVFLRLFHFKEIIVQNIDLFKQGFAITLQDYFESRGATEIESKVDLVNNAKFAFNKNEIDVHPLDSVANRTNKKFSNYQEENPSTTLVAPKLGKCRLGINSTCGPPMPDEQLTKIVFSFNDRSLLKFFVDIDELKRINAIISLYFEYFSPLYRRLSYPLKIKVSNQEVVKLRSSKDNISYSNILGFGVLLA